MNPITSHLFSFKLPTEIFYGIGTRYQTGKKVKEFGANRVMIVTDRGVSGSNLLEDIVSSLSKESIEYLIFDEVIPNSNSDIVKKGRDMAKESRTDLVIGVGGGSSIDSAKAIAMLLTNPGDLEDYVGVGKVKEKPKPIIAIPTTAGTGSEVTIFSVITDSKTKMKTAIGSYLITPYLALLDPELTITLPPSITAATGLDALTHAIECYVATSTQPISEALCLRAIKLISRNLRNAFANGKNLQARDGMLMGSLLAGMALNPTRLGICHALAMPLGSHPFYIPHGLANAIVLPEVIGFNVISSVKKYAIIAKILGDKDPEGSLLEKAHYARVAVEELLRDLEIKMGLSNFGVQVKDLKAIVDEAMKSGNILVNPRQPTWEDVMNICKSSL